MVLHIIITIIIIIIIIINPIINDEIINVTTITIFGSFKHVYSLFLKAINKVGLNSPIM